MEQPIWNFEQEPWEASPDETSVNLRAHFDRIPDDKIQQYRADWNDEQVMDWDGDFTDEGTLLLACSERDVEIDEFRKVLEQAITYRNRTRPALVNA
jgi:hypothetical protein